MGGEVEGVEVLVRLLHRRHRGRRPREGGRGRHPVGGEEVHPRVWPGCNPLDVLIQIWWPYLFKYSGRTYSNIATVRIQI